MGAAAEDDDATKKNRWFQKQRVDDEAKDEAPAREEGADRSAVGRRGGEVEAIVWGWVGGQGTQRQMGLWGVLHTERGEGVDVCMVCEQLSWFIWAGIDTGWALLCALASTVVV